MNTSFRDAARQDLTKNKRSGLVHISEIIPEVLEDLGAGDDTDDPRANYVRRLVKRDAGPARAGSYERGSRKDSGGWYAGSFGWSDSEAGSSLAEDRDRRRKLIERWLTLHKNPPTAAREKRLRPPTRIRRPTAESVRAAAIAEVERACGFRGHPSENWGASNSLDLADQEIDRLALGHEELEQARSQHQPARVAA